MDNGYFVIKIWDNIYPAEVQFDLFLDAKMTDCSIIVDHLSCPAQPFDGFGLFNISYSLTHSIKNNVFISKNDKNKPSYKLNESFSKEKYNKDYKNHYVILNELKEIQCHFCELQATNLIFYSYPVILVPVCIAHLNRGSNREIDSNKECDIDIRKSYRNNIKQIQHEKNGKIITQNTYIENFDQ